MTIIDKFKLDGKVAVVTGGAGLLGEKHAQAIIEAGGVPVLWDIEQEAVSNRSQELAKLYNCGCLGMAIDITDAGSVEAGLKDTIAKVGRLDILINNAANNPKVKAGGSLNMSRLENFTIDAWHDDIAVGLTGAFLCSRVLGGYMARNGGGVILNIASDLGVIAPDQRIYRQAGLSEEQQPVKPVTYSVVKHGLIGLTKYLATYWADKNIRINSISPGGIYSNQPEEFVHKVSGLIPLGRMARDDEYMAAVLFLISEASSYMTGANLVVDGGRTCW